jgi:hypothetical protein
MDSMRNLNTSLPGGSPSKNAISHDTPEQLLDAFKAAALSVTKLYKTSASAQSKARQDGYQECLDDLLAFLDKENIGLGDGEGWRIRSWATERLGGDGTMQVGESDDEVDKAETASSPELTRAGSVPRPSTKNEIVQDRQDSAPPSVPPVVEQSAHFTVPTQEAFTFQSSHPYPQQDALNFANLDLSDARTLETTQTAPAPPTRSSRTRHGINGRSASRSGHLGRGAGQKRKINFAEIFDLGSLGYGKDVFGSGGGKRSRHV